ncbi:MAG: polyprenyl synthetase family protein, partial [Candidatus Diapherotrites archaeon]|nr:polyprenyl synthetase family protein [Candidatus Diapherotrites archaeon]
DNSDVRRTKPTMHKKYGVPLSILSGDVMFAYVFKIICDTKFSDDVKIRLVKLFSDKSIELGQGEVHQIEAIHSSTLDEKVYARVAQKKTSALFDVALLSGAIIGGASEEILEKLVVYSNKLGLAFQIRDDILDLTGEENIIGKTSGNDIKEGKRTLITIHALNHLPKDKSKMLNNILNIPSRHTSDKDVGMAMELILEANSIKFAQEFAENLGEEGIAVLNVIPNERVRSVFADLMNFAIQRDN